MAAYLHQDCHQNNTQHHPTGHTHPPPPDRIPTFPTPPTIPTQHQLTPKVDFTPPPLLGQPTIDTLPALTSTLESIASDWNDALAPLPSNATDPCCPLTDPEFCTLSLACITLQLALSELQAFQAVIQELQPYCVGSQLDGGQREKRLDEMVEDFQEYVGEAVELYARLTAPEPGRDEVPVRPTPVGESEPCWCPGRVSEWYMGR